MADWAVDVKVKVPPGMGKAMRHHPAVVAVLADIAAQIAARATAGHKEARYGVIVQNKASTRRARALVHPVNNAGIHVELTQHAMIKAAAGAQHKAIPIGVKPSSAAQTMGGKIGDSAATVGPGGVLQPISPTATNTPTKPK